MRSRALQTPMLYSYYASDARGKTLAPSVSTVSLNTKNQHYSRITTLTVMLDSLASI
jgi:hypothetical protein